jgi:hypothetical protein
MSPASNVSIGLWQPPSSQQSNTGMTATVPLGPTVINCCNLEAKAIIMRDSICFFTPPNAERLTAFLPKGTDVSTFVGPPSVSRTQKPSDLPLAFCPEHEDLRPHRLEANISTTLLRQTCYRINDHSGEPVDYDMPAGTLRQTAFQHCPSCLSTAAGFPVARPPSWLQVGGRNEGKFTQFPGSDLAARTTHLPTTVKIDCLVFRSSTFTIGPGDNYLYPSRGDISGVDVPTGKGYYTIVLDLENPEIEGRDKWEREGATDTLVDRGDTLFMPYGPNHMLVVTVENPRETSPGSRMYQADQTHIGQIPIPNRAISRLLPAWNLKMKKQRDALQCQAEGESCSE